MQFNEGRMATTLQESLLVVKSGEVGTVMGRVCQRCQGLRGSGWSGYVRGLEQCVTGIGVGKGMWSGEWSQEWVRGRDWVA
jgi:hypothetical protein